MNRLQTYRRDKLDPLVDRVAAIERRADQPLPVLRPGLIVEVPGLIMGGGFGIVVAVSDEEVTVLWSKLPRDSVLFEPEDFKPRKGILARYGQAKVRKEYYGTIMIQDIK